MVASSLVKALSVMWLGLGSRQCAWPQRRGRGEEANEGRSRRSGTEVADLDETQLQTQRARLQQMQLSTGRARQILESLGAAEQQYLQQLPRRAVRKQASDKPAW
ncbi:hypothetical protein H9L05_19650 [Hymenobacter qilianensis]|uniref:Uncharacterized protein n=1 Tax=Hymenobacter qilianensis TaxID=1385715 RepID=A0A7H0GUW0_9BACT|nr:hypothetical protein [Hymenobacter qilianensis]QNP52076.1 hypothetical protein H9L05_19650 [Hymenobacter qilianensis]